MATTTQNPEQEVLQPIVPPQESGGRFDTESTASLRLKANSLIENISAMRHAILKIEYLEKQIEHARTAIAVAKPWIVAANLEDKFAPIEEALRN